MRKVRHISIDKPDGGFLDLVELYGWLGKTRLSGHRFNIQVSIVETDCTEEESGMDPESSEDQQ